MRGSEIDVLIPTYRRRTALSILLASLCAQDFRSFRVLISDQTEDSELRECAEANAALRVLRAHGHSVALFRNLPRRGMAEQQQFLLDRSRAPFVLYLDDDLLLERQVIGNLYRAITEEQCGFVGCSVIGLSHIDDVRPEEQAIEFWDGPVRPERITPDSPKWRRHWLHNAANLHHVQQRFELSLDAPRRYRVAWVGGCVLYSAAKLRAAGAFDFWRRLANTHSGEDVLAQLRVMERFGGCGLIPSGVYHQELGTTVPDRRIDAPRVLRSPQPAPPAHDGIPLELRWLRRGRREVRYGRPLGRSRSQIQPAPPKPSHPTHAGRGELKKIAVLPPNGIGDFVFTLPAFAALRARYPRAEIVLLGREWHAELLHDRPGPIDRAIVTPPYPGVGADPRISVPAAVIESFFGRMRAEQFDAAVQIYGGGRYSNPFVLRLGACRTVGLKAEDAVELNAWVPYVYWQSEIIRFLEVVGLLDARPVGLDPHLVVTADDLREADPFIRNRGGPLAILHPGATDARRRWPAENFAAVGDALHEIGARVAIIGTETEREQTQRVRAAMKAPVLDLCARLSLRGLTGLLSRAQVVVGNDSGPLHLARAVGAPTAGVFWCGNVITAGMVTRSRHRPVISWRLECPVCGRNTIHARCDHEASFVAEVSVADVVSAAMDLLAATPVAV